MQTKSALPWRKKKKTCFARTLIMNFRRDIRGKYWHSTFARQFFRTVVADNLKSMRFLSPSIPSFVYHWRRRYARIFSRQNIFLGGLKFNEQQRRYFSPVSRSHGDLGGHNGIRWTPPFPKGSAFRSLFSLFGKIFVHGGLVGIRRPYDRFFCTTDERETIRNRISNSRSRSRIKRGRLKTQRVFESSQRITNQKLPVLRTNLAHSCRAFNIKYNKSIPSLGIIS